MNILQEISQTYNLSLPENESLSLENPTKIFNPDKEGIKIVSEYAEKLGLSVLPQENGHIIVAKGLERFTFLMFKFNVSTYKSFHGLPLSLVWNILRQFSAKSTFVFIRSDRRLLHQLKFNIQARENPEEFAVKIKAARRNEDGSLDWHPIGHRLEELINPFHRQLDMEEKKDSDGTYYYGSTGDYEDVVKSKQVLWKTGVLTYLEDVLISIAKGIPVSVNLNRQENLFSYDGDRFVSPETSCIDLIDDDDVIEDGSCIGKLKFTKQIKDKDSQERIMAIENHSMKLAERILQKDFYSIQNTSTEASYDFEAFKKTNDKKCFIEVKGKSNPFVDSPANFIMTINEVLLATSSYDSYYLVLVTGIKTLKIDGVWTASGGTIHLYEDYFPGKKAGGDRSAIMRSVLSLNDDNCYPIKFRPIVNLEDADEIYTEDLQCLKGKRIKQDFCVII